MKTLKLEEIKQIELNLLSSIDDFCKENNLHYCLAGGTLLGAVRHKGFIPWDDDIDIFMPRKEYETFVDSYRSDTSKVITMNNTDGYPYPFAKLIDCATIVKEYRFPNYECGVYIDIFPIDDLGSDMDAIIQLNKKISKYRKLLNIKMNGLSYYHGIKKVIFFLIKLLLLPFSSLKLEKCITNGSQKLNDKNSKYCGCMVMLTYGIREIFEKSWFETTCRLSFEDREFCAPTEYDKVLKALYGDYMKLPPAEKQITHHSFDAWEK